MMLQRLLTKTMVRMVQNDIGLVWVLLPEKKPFTLAQLYEDTKNLRELVSRRPGRE